MNNNIDLEELINSVDIVDYISQFVDLELKVGEWWGLSPFKAEVTPSFSVHPDKQVFYDFSSGESGNLFTFIMKYHKCSARKAIDILKEYIGESANNLCMPHKLIATRICRQFKPKDNVKECIAEEIPESFMDKYILDWNKLSEWENEGITREIMEKYFVRYDPVSNRIVYPIRDLNGKILNLGMRTLDPLYKEKKLRKYTYINKWGTIKTIYGYSDNIKNIIDRKEVIVFEGAKSVMKADVYGFNNAVALLTSHLSPQQMKILCEIGVKYRAKIIFALDNDVVIRKDKNIMALRNYANVFYIHDSKHLLQEKDSPVDAGEKVFEELYKNIKRL